MSLKRKIGGLVAKRSGQRFEHMVSSVAHVEGIACVRIPDGSRMVRGRTGALVNIGQTSPWDFCMAYRGAAAFLDTKCTEDMTFAASKIKSHQLYALQKMEDQGCLAGYLILFDRTGPGMIRFVPASMLVTIKKGQSINSAHGIGLGTQFNFSLKPIFKL